jgi:hypothetical protein
MHEGASAAAGTPRASNMSPRQRRAALMDLIGAAIARAVGSRDMPPDGPEPPDPGSSVDALALSPESRLSVAARGEPAPGTRNETKAGEHA